MSTSSSTALNLSYKEAPCFTFFFVKLTSYTKPLNVFPALAKKVSLGVKDLWYFFFHLLLISSNENTFPSGVIHFISYPPFEKSTLPSFEIFLALIVTFFSEAIVPLFVNSPCISIFVLSLDKSSCVSTFKNLLGDEIVILFEYIEPNLDASTLASLLFDPKITLTSSFAFILPSLINLTVKRSMNFEPLRPFLVILISPFSTVMLRLSSILPVVNTAFRIFSNVKPSTTNPFSLEIYTSNSLPLAASKRPLRADFSVPFTFNKATLASLLDKFSFLEIFSPFDVT